MRIRIEGINLLPKEYIIAEKVKFYQKIGAVVLVIWTLCFIAFVALPPKREVVRTRDLLLEKQQEVNSARYAGVNKTLSDLEQAKTDMQMLINNYNHLKKDSYISGQFLDELINRVPSHVTIQKLSINSPAESNVKQINMEYKAGTMREGQSYLTILELLLPTASIKSEYAHNEEEEVYTYTTTIEVTEQIAEQSTTAEPSPAPTETPTTGEGATN